MKITEIIRSLLDRLDQLEQDRERDQADPNRTEQIKDLRHNQSYSTQPQEQYAGIDAVTKNAGGGWQGSKDPADIKGEHPSLYPGKVYGER
jgi:hypothetical protein